MKHSLRIVTLCLSIIAGFVLVSCQSDDYGDPHLHGYVIEKADGRILVISKEAQDFSDTGGISNFYDAIFLRNAPQHVEIGHEVLVWIDGPVEESYPSGGTIGKLEIVERDEPMSAKLTAQKAVQKALRQIGEEHLVAITNVSYHEEKSVWEVTYASIMAFDEEDQEPTTIEISDEAE